MQAIFEDGQNQLDLSLQLFLQTSGCELSLHPGNSEQSPPKHKQPTPTKKTHKTHQHKERRKHGDSLHRNIKKGHWSYQQNKKYHWFLEIYYKHFLDKHMRRTDKIFKIMEAFLGTRQAEQCRSHHQKMEKKHKNFQAILLHLRRQHHGTDDHLPVTNDLLTNNISFCEELAHAATLTNDPQIKIQYQSQEDEKNFLPLPHELKTIENIWSDKYEHQMDFNNITI